MKKLIIIGGGASGFFLASNIKSKKWEVIILEKSDKPLQKLKISGGGRCNVTNACFNNRDLVNFYPRGKKELMSVFSQFQPSDTFQWFSDRKVNLNIENDNRVFPLSNDSQTIINTFLKETDKNNIKVFYNSPVSDIEIIDNKYIVKTAENTFESDALVIATGNAPNMWKILKKLGHDIISPIPSLFTFKCKNELIQNLQGISFPEATVEIKELKQKEFGGLLITHLGFSGPVILRLSAWKARELSILNYKFQLNINWISEKFEDVRNQLTEIKNQNPKKSIYTIKIYNLTTRFWHNTLNTAKIKDKILADLKNTEINKITEILTSTQLNISGKNTNKDEFVTCGGVNLKEIDFKTMQSKIHPNLYLCGEVLDIDAITGGFNFQACWSEAFIISKNFI